jgi:cytochrome c6
MKKVLAFVLPVLITVLLSISSPAHSFNLESGESVFTANCAACHNGGNNLVIPDKTLKKDALEENGMNSTSAITNQVTNGKNAMPAFGGRLTPEQIDDVANYVLNQSEQGW